MSHSKDINEWTDVVFAMNHTLSLEIDFWCPTQTENAYNFWLKADIKNFYVTSLDFYSILIKKVSEWKSDNWFSRFLARYFFEKCSMVVVKIIIRLKFEKKIW